MSSHNPLTTHTGEEIFPLEIGYLPETFKKKAELELNYNTKVREETLTELKYRITENWKFERHPAELLKHIFLITLMMCQLEPLSQVKGYKIIVNLNASPKILRIVTPNNTYRLYYGSQHIVPARTKEIHFVNMGWIGRTLFQLNKLFYSEKLLKRIHVHAKSNSLLKHFPKEVIPNKYGGDLSDYDMTDWLKKNTSPETLSTLEVD